MRAAAIALAAVMLLAFAAPNPVVAQEGRNTSPTELWENYPLDAGADQESTTGGAGPSRAKSAAPNAASEPADGGPSLFLLMIPPVLVTAGLLFLAARQRRLGTPLRELWIRHPAEPRPLAPGVVVPSPAVIEPPPPRPVSRALPPADPDPPPSPAAQAEPAPPPSPAAQAEPAPPPSPAARAEPAPAAEPAPRRAPRPRPAFEPPPLWASDADPPSSDERAPGLPPSNRFARARTGALGYVSVPAVDDSHREDLRRQVRRIRRACDALELSLLEMIPDDESEGHTPVERPGFRRALRRLDRGEAECLVTTRVERLASSAEEWVLLLELLDDYDVRLIVVDDALDTGATAGREEAWGLIGLEPPVAPGQP